ncbi:MAG: aldo/keto reductase [Bacteroidetes bacterium]|nr:aldo/keto reductase [Bacteroidota bacterium]
MQTQKILNTDLNPTRIIYGCMNLGNNRNRAELSESEMKREAVKTINAALEQGINMFDHADIYGRGKSEEMFSEIWKEHPGLRDKIILQSKCGIRFTGDPTPDAPHRFDFSYEHIKNSVDEILKRLKTEYLDILLLHRPDPLVEPEEVAKAFDELHQIGKVKYFGVSNHTGFQIDLLKKFVDQPLVVNQLEINLIHSDLINAGVITNQRKPVEFIRGEGTLEYCRLHDITIQAWSPLAVGAFENINDDFSKNLSTVILEIAKNKNVSVEAVIAAWLLKHPAKIQPVIGTRRPEKIKAICQADSLELSRYEWYKLFIAGRGEDLP